MCNLHRCYTFCTGVTLFTLVTHLNCTALSQSESSNFFVCIIRQVKTVESILFILSYSSESFIFLLLPTMNSLEAKIINLPLYAVIERATERNIIRLMKASESNNITYIVLLWKDCKFSVRTTGIFTCSVSNSVTCFMGVLRATGIVGSGLLYLFSVGRLVVPSLTLTACFPQAWATFVPVEIKIKRSIY